MSTTRMTATNTLNKGLVMDFNPAITKEDCLTNALNATLLTFNGNEMQLQQDMGNGRVETAYLPEGYIPVGTCEFGDIIYIVSYNPLENKSQIGCFPSPERNVTSEELTEMQQALKASDFQQLSGSTPTGKLVATSVKKIVYGNKNMNPGDKYVIYEESSVGALKANKDTLTDYANTSHQLQTWPKLLRLKVVSIEDSGKIVDLGATVKWYDNDYYLASLANSATTGKADIDSYRSLVSSAYSVFQSKVSGKLAILAELEAIDGFSCTYDVYTTIDEATHTTHYNIYFYTAWETSHNDVNPSGFLVTKSAWASNTNGGKLLTPVKEGDAYVYKVDNKAQALPIETGATASGYDASKVIEYTRLYSLEDPSKTYQSYNEDDSFAAKLPSIVSWSASNIENYKAVAGLLRPITRVSRVLKLSGEDATGEPDINDKGEQSYVFNLDSYISGDSGITYQTKATNGELLNLNAVVLTDDIVNNYFGKDIPKLIKSDYTLNTSTVVKDSEDNDVVLDNDLTNLIWNYAVAPVMPYGVLDYLETTGTIDFSKIGKGLIDLTGWRYYTAGNVLTLTWGLDAYIENNKGIAEVVLDFFDNQGIAASYHVTGKTSYAGTFTENIILGQKNSSYKLNSVDALGNSYKHAGESANSDESDVVYLTSTNAVSEAKTGYGPYKNDAGTLYSNLLYLVRITVKYCAKDPMGNFVTENTTNYKTYYRWLWTNGIFNDYYYNTNDFKSLQPALSLDFSATFSTKGDKGTNAMSASQFLYMNNSLPGASDLQDQAYQTIGANVYVVNQDGSDDSKGNVLLTLDPGLAEGYNTFNLNEAYLDLIDKITINLGKSSIKKSVDSPGFLYTGTAFTHTISDNIQPQIAGILDSHDTSGWDRSGYASYRYGLNNAYVSDNFLSTIKEGLTAKTFSKNGKEDTSASTAINTSKDELYATDEAYKAYLDSFSLNMIGASLTSGESLTYSDSDGNTQTLTHYTSKTVNMKQARTDGIQLALAGIAFSKLFAAESTKDSSSKVLSSIMKNSSGTYNSPTAYGLRYYNSHLYFSRVLAWYMGESGGKDTRWGASYHDSTSGSGWGTVSNDNSHSSHDDWNPDFTNEEVQSEWKGAATLPFIGFAWTRSGSSNGNINKVYSDVSWKAINASFGISGVEYVYPSKSSCPIGGSSFGTYGSDIRVIHTFAVYDQTQNLVVPFADYFVGASNGQTKRGGSPITSTLADMLGSLLMQLYVVDSSGSVDNALISNFVYLQDYTETWNKDIIVQVDPTEGQLAKQTNINNLITIQAQTATNYFNFVKNNSKLTTEELENLSDDNINIKLYGMQRVISFQFGVPYNLGNLLYLYNQKNTSQNIINLAVLDSSSSSPTTKQFTGSVTANTLYTWTGDNITPFGQGSSMTYASTFVEKNGLLYMVSSGTSMKSTAFAALAKIMQYNGGELTFDNLSQFSTWNSTYRVRYDGTGDDPGIKALPMISIFNEYKPGK